MTVKDGVIVEATRDELYNYWLRRGFDNFISFSDYLKKCEELGTKITSKEV